MALPLFGTDIIINLLLMFQRYRTFEKELQAIIRENRLYSKIRNNLSIIDKWHLLQKA